MSNAEDEKAKSIFHISESSITNLTGSGDIHYTESPNNADPTLPKRTILVLAANPKNTSQIRLAEEVREIHAGLKRAKKRDDFLLEQRWAVRPRDLQRALLEVKPQIVHFCGHGTGPFKPETIPVTARDIAPFPEAGRVIETEGLVLEDDTGQAVLVSAPALAALFELFSDSLECVLLNACYSYVQAEAIAEHIPYVVGMSREVNDRAAIEFAIAFYDALGAGESIEFAFKFSCASVQISGSKEHTIPVLHHSKRVRGDS